MFSAASLVLLPRRCRADDLPRVASPVFFPDGIGPAQLSGTSRTLRIASQQVTGDRPRCAQPLRGTGAIGEANYYSGSLHRLSRASGGMADALASGASVLRDVGVQVPLRPPS